MCIRDRPKVVAEIAQVVPASSCWPRFDRARDNARGVGLEKLLLEVCAPPCQMSVPDIIAQHGRRQTP
eukprot:2675435-Rhodomonas_salina.1